MYYHEYKKNRFSCTQILLEISHIHTHTFTLSHVHAHATLTSEYDYPCHGL